jgi:hypothetical protein
MNHQQCPSLRTSVSTPMATLNLALKDVSLLHPVLRVDDVAKKNGEMTGKQSRWKATPGDIDRQV